MAWLQHCCVGAGVNGLGVRMLVKLVGYARSGLLGLAFCTSAAIAQDEITNDGTVKKQEPFPVSYEDVEKVPEDFQRQEVPYDTPHPAGTLVVDTDNRYLYLVLPEARAIRYGIGVGREGFEWNGIAEIGRKTSWPYWFPPKAMVARDRFAAKWARGMPGGPKNPLGARALYLYANGADTLYRIHGTNQPSSIGQAVSSGCVRMLNIDVIDLYGRVNEGTKVVVMGTPSRTKTAAKATPKKRKLKQFAQPERDASFALYQRWRLAKGGPGKKVALKSNLVRRTNFNLNRPKLASQ
jgi:lipoprotein-anchoring transpeptidase ErfK/SrfK